MLWQEWLNFLVRWAHLIFGISWIGSSFYFMWLDSHLEEPAARSDVEGELWMTHSGGFYHVQRKKIGPGKMPKTLHWFKYEALFTWVSGVFMLGLVYYMTGGAYLVDPSVRALTPGQATGAGIALLVVSWFVYDGIWVTIGKKAAGVATAISLALAVALAYVLCHLFSGRGAFIHLGAVFGTIMVANVWVRILPAQQKMIDATERGETPDFAHSGYAKRRSVHNSYMTFPVLFMMLSNHYAMAYSGALNWVLLLLLIVFGIAFRHVLIAKNGSGKWALVPSAAALLALMVLSAHSSSGPAAAGANAATVTFAEAHTVIKNRCLACHSANPTDKEFGPATGGVHFDDPARIQSYAARIKERAVVTKTMPLANKTGMTDAEREVLARWLEQGARIDDGAAH